jgi:hypothetical protein
MLFGLAGWEWTDEGADRDGWIAIPVPERLTAVLVR